MPHQQSVEVPQFFLLPELKLTKWNQDRSHRQHLWLEKKSRMEVCPKCANPSEVLYDHRWVKVHDQPIRGVDVWMHILKRRFYCKSCRKPFTEPIAGVRKGKRTTERFRRGLLWACENLQDLAKVRTTYQCSTWMIYQTLKEHLQLKLKEEVNYPWPTTVGIDEHFFSRSKGYKEFATVLVDYNHKRVREIVLGRSKMELQKALEGIAGRENVKNVVLDMSDTYKSFAREFFPRAILIADKFHVLRLLNPSLNRRRKEITGDVRKNPIRKLLLRNRKNLEYFERSALDQWLQQNPVLNEVYHYKEALYGFYRIKGYNRARRALTKMTDRMALSNLPEIKTLRRTLMRWREEILNYFKTGITNARTEGFNNVAKLVQKRAYGVKSFEMYRLRYLSACA
jgi:transposase